MKKSLYRTNPGDREIFRLSEENPDIFTNYYLRSDKTGTWWLPGAKSDKWRTGYDVLLRVWKSLGKPDHFVHADNYYKVVFEHEKSKEYPNLPAFFHNHGFIMLDYGKELHLDRTPIRVIVGGFGCIAPWTRIYDHATGQHIPVEVMVERGYAPTVLAWDSGAFRPVQATVPWLKGVADLYRVTTESGNEITVTLDHRFLTTDGWLTLRDIRTRRDAHLMKYDDGSAKPDRIVSIDFSASAAPFYDLHVPVYENYLAEGVINHNSGKTLNTSASVLTHAATLPGFRAFCLAPLSLQAEEMYKLMLQLIQGTLYEERFFIAAPKRPFPHIIIGNDVVGMNTIEFYPILNNSEKIRTLTGDLAVIDQAEKLEDLEGVVRDVGTRFRGRVPTTGRERIGTLTFLANSEDNQQLWDMFDMAQVEPEFYKAMSPSSYDNPYLTDKDIQRYERQVGTGKEAIDQYMNGARPRGNGKHFSRAVLDEMADSDLDRVMEMGLNAGVPGYVKLEKAGVGIYEWLLPPQDDRTYLVMSDPGTDNPPNRDSPPILVWDITGFPGTRANPVPAKLVGFVWVFGNHNISNWATRYAEVVHRYKALGTNGFDATGFQAGYDQWIIILDSLFPEKINLAGNGKPLCLNSAKVLTTRGMIRIPASLSVIFNQLARYDLPEPKNLRQDIVMAFIMSCWWLMRLFFFDDSEYEEHDYYDPSDRHSRPLVTRYNHRRR